MNFLNIRSHDLILLTSIKRDISVYCVFFDSEVHLPVLLCARAFLRSVQSFILGGGRMREVVVIEMVTAFLVVLDCFMA